MCVSGEGVGGGGRGGGRGKKSHVYALGISGGSFPCGLREGQANKAPLCGGKQHVGKDWEEDFHPFSRETRLHARCSLTFLAALEERHFLTGTMGPLGHSCSLGIDELERVVGDIWSRLSPAQGWISLAETPSLLQTSQGVHSTLPPSAVRSFSDLQARWGSRGLLPGLHLSHCVLPVHAFSGDSVMELVGFNE